MLGVRTITWIVFIGFQFFGHMYHLGEDLGCDWIWASYLIKYVHNGWSCDLGIFGIPEVNFPSNLILLRPYEDTWYKSRVLLNFNICIFLEYFYAFLNESGCSVMSTCCPDNNLNCFFIGFHLFLYMYHLGQDLGWIEDGHHTSLNMCIMADHVILVFLRFLESISQSLKTWYVKRP